MDIYPTEVWIQRGLARPLQICIQRSFPDNVDDSQDWGPPVKGESLEGRWGGDVRSHTLFNTNIIGFFLGASGKRICIPGNMKLARTEFFFLNQILEVNNLGFWNWQTQILVLPLLLRSWGSSNKSELRSPPVAGEDGGDGDGMQPVLHQLLF